jgi:hypothetical protein
MIAILINSVDRSSEIENDSVIFQQSVTKEPSTLSFNIKKSSSKTIPVLGDEVLLQEDGDNIFKGTITERKEVIIDGLLIAFEFGCKDGLHDFDRQLVKKAYNGVDAVSVAQDIVDSFTSGFTLDAPASGPVIDTIRFNYEQPSKAMQALCDAIGWDWYIDADDVVHFFAAGAELAPFSITDDNGKAAFGSLEFDGNILELKNVVYVRGGEYEDAVSESDALDKYIADGTQVTFNLGYRYNNVEVSVNGSAKTVGVDFIDDPADFDCLYNYQEKLIRFRDDNKPTSGQTVKVFGNALIPLIVQAQDDASIAAYGRFEGIQIDQSINSIAEAESVASELLSKWSAGSYEGKFRTLEKGLRAGQYITINSTLREVNDSFKINQITGKMKGYDRFEYSVQFIKSGQVTFTDMMVGLLSLQKKNITISDDEVIQRLTKMSDAVGIADELVSITKTSPPYKYGAVSPGNTVGKYGFSTYG